MRNRNIWLVVALAGAAVWTQAQWLNHAAPGTPRTRDGKTNLTAPAPRASNGKPDLSGVWEVEASSFAELSRLIPGGQNVLGEDVPSKYFINILADFKSEEAPVRAADAALFRQRAEAFGKDYPVIRCLPAGVPNGDLVPEPHKIAQMPGLVVMLYENNTNFRQIFTDGRKLPDDPQPAWTGYSVGKWEGDALVVDTAGFNDQGWLDAFGLTHSDALHVTERFHRRDFGHLEQQITIDDPKAYTRPFTIKVTQRLLPDTDLLENYCAENEKDRPPLVGK